MKYSLIIIVLFIAVSCTQESSKRITQAEDYNVFLGFGESQKTSKYFELWNSKIQPDSMQLMSFGIVAGEYNRYFQETGDIKQLKMAERALDKAVEIAAVGKSGYYRALARNYISQHRFKEALELANSSRAMGSGVGESQKLLFDIHMELGNYGKARHYLDSIKNMSDFDYLIRLAKWNDHKGDLETAIRFMEKAKERAESSKNSSIILWSYTNLADYYGHAGRIQDSYEHYLKSLRLDPQNAYAKKGIAWIVFSYEKNPKEALRILDSVTKNYLSPDYYLLKAEIAEYMGDRTEMANNLDSYAIAVANPDYGAMYNVYNVGMYLEQTEQYTRALKVAEVEVNNRSTPGSYDLLAYSYYKLGQKDKALEIVKQHIEGKTFEPGILYRSAVIYKATGEYSKVEELKTELLGAIYELGPSMESKIMNL
ncbi:tetratricopeptide repeat protein [Arenibacter sp. N53]|uniref:tetratricopeptide repeat protein n=1 Tax=Arenibacter TaxID=178469 RepID=UPI000CD3D2C2|nr:MULTISPECIES: tetratricopeptide repeat protein [Arenibacter]MCM4153273.1 tetratricopeptide repeat protein [Arenibacter sp. N53]